MSGSTSTATHFRTAPSCAGPWSKLTPPLTPWILSFLSDLQFHQMTPVQASTIPLFLSHKDVVVEAVTGSGKTLAFVLPVLEMLLRRSKKLRKDEVGALIVSPTRELAEQIYNVTKMFIDAQGKVEEEVVEVEDEEEVTSDNDGDSESDSDSDPKPKYKSAPPARKPTRIAGVQLVVGGTTKTTPATDYRLFRDSGPDILIGTPGRLEELLSKPGVKKSSLEVLILDEADRLLDLGFTENLRRILSFLPKQRRTGLFSATMTDALGELVRMGLRNPVRVVVKVESKNKSGDERRTPASLQNLFQVCKPENKFAQLLRILRAEANEGKRKFIVYFATCAQVDYFHTLSTRLSALNGLTLFALHGKQTPSKRKSQFDGFVSSSATSVLLCTDVAARGLDLPDVEVVVQYDPPTDPKVFSHRCGRTARAGRRGRAVVMLQRNREEDFVAYCEGRRIPLSKYPYLSDELEGVVEGEEDHEARQLERKVREVAKEDREVLEQATRAYVSYVRAYSKHEMSYIFRLADLDLAAVAHAFGLIRLPAMPELKARKATGTLHYDEEQVDFNAILFKDRTKERARQLKIQEVAATKAKAEEQAVREESGESDSSDSSANAANAGKKKRKLGSAGGGAWSAQKERKEVRLAKKEKRARKRAFLKAQLSTSKADPQGDEEEEEEEDDWDQDYRLLQKEKRDKQKAARNGRRDDDDEMGFASDNSDGGRRGAVFVI